MSDSVTIRISGKSMSTIEGSEIYWSPEKYDGGSQDAIDAYEALRASRRVRAGKGWSYPVEVSPGGADIIADYCEVVGEGFFGESEPETRADGRALLATATRIRAVLAHQGQKS